MFGQLAADTGVELDRLVLIAVSLYLIEQAELSKENSSQATHMRQGSVVTYRYVNFSSSHTTRQVYRVL